MNSFSNSWALMKESLSILAKDKEILVLPILSGIACILVTLSFALPLLLTFLAGGAWRSDAEPFGGGLAAVLVFTFYLVNYFVITFFNTAVVACAAHRLEGGDPTVGYGLRVAADNLVPILTWSLVSATVGMILKGIERRAGWLGRLIIGIVGVAWALVTYLIIPVMIFEKRGVIESIKRSAELFTQNWGRQIAGSIGMGLAFFVLTIPGFIPVLFGAATGTWQGVAAGVGVTVLYMILLAALASALRGVYTAALYHYATTQQVPGGFSSQFFTQPFHSR